MKFYILAAINLTWENFKVDVTSGQPVKPSGKRKVNEVPTPGASNDQQFHSLVNFLR